MPAGEQARASGCAGTAKSKIARTAEREFGLARARAWREAQQRPTAVLGPYPFRDHRTCAEWR